MRALVVSAGFALLAGGASAEVRAEAHTVGEATVRITVEGNLETLSVALPGGKQVPLLSGADVEILAPVADPDSVAMLGRPVLVAEVTGTHSCDAGDALQYWLVTLDKVPTAEGPLTTCQALAPSIMPGALVLTGEGEAWAWSPGQIGWTARAN